MDAVELLERWYAEARASLPPGASVWDAHTHTGHNDPDGMAQTDDELVRTLDAVGHETAVVCSSADPGGYRDANDRIVRESVAAGGRLVPFMRVDPRREDAIDEVERCAAAGHRGIKLHPHAEAFTFDLPRLDPILDIAAERRLPVLVHAGRTMPPLGPRLVDHLDRRDGLTIILAHCAISDLGWAAPAAATRPGLMFDTAWWNPADLAALFAWVDASQILYASDTPYGWPPMSATISIRAALQAGLVGPALTAVFGANLRRLLSGEKATPFGRGVEFHPDLVLQRVAANLYGAVLGAFRGLDVSEPIDLALRACEMSGTRHDRLLAGVRSVLTIAREAPGPDRRRGRLGLILVALSAVVTPIAPIP